MRGNAEAAQPPYVFDHRRGLATERIGRSTHVQRNVVTPVRADLDAIEAQHAIGVGRRILLPRAVAVIREDHEAQAGRGGGRRDLVAAVDAIGNGAVDVKRARDGSRGDDRIDIAGGLDRTRRKGEAR